MLSYDPVCPLYERFLFQTLIPISADINLDFTGADILKSRPHGVCEIFCDFHNFLTFEINPHMFVVIY